MESESRNVAQTYYLPHSAQISQNFSSNPVSHKIIIYHPVPSVYFIFKFVRSNKISSKLHVNAACEGNGEVVWLAKKYCKHVIKNKRLKVGSFRNF